MTTPKRQKTGLAKYIDDSDSDQDLSEDISLGEDFEDDDYTSLT